MEVNAVIPLFRVFDLKKAREFYIDYLGFKVDWEHTFEPGLPVYMQISRGKTFVLHLTEHHGDCCPGSTAYVRLRKGLREFHREISSKGYNYLRPGIEKQEYLSSKGYNYLRPGIEKQEWGEISVELTDPFGNRLRLAEKIITEDELSEKAPQT